MATVIVGVSVVVTPMKATLTAFGAVPTVWTWYGASAKSGVVQPAVAQLPVSFLTMFAVTYGYVASVVRLARFAWPQSNSWLPKVATL